MEQDARKARRPKGSYTTAVDIWSLGVAVLESVYGHLSGTVEGVSWCKKIAKKLKADLEKDPNPLRHFLLGSMVILQPAERGWAQGCYEQVRGLIDQAQDCCSTPTPGVAPQDYVTDACGTHEQAILPHDAHAAAGPWPSPVPAESSIHSVERRVRSGAPPPDSEVFAPVASQENLAPVNDDSKTRKRSKRPSKSSSLESRSKRPGNRSNTAQSSTRQHTQHLQPEADYYYYHGSNSVLQGLPEESGWDEQWQTNMQPGVPGVGDQSNDLGPYSQHGYDPAQAAPAPGDPQDWGGEGQAEGGGWADSEAQMAAMLLYGMRQQES
jgi:serine/threonine protein kinase